MKQVLPPINIQQWIEKHKDNLKPPVANKQVYETGDFIIMIVGGPNARKDYHDDPGDEFFFQLKGDMVLRVMEESRPRDIPIREGEIFMLPAHMPHSPQRSADTVGMVIERKRAPGELDGFIWYCDSCNQKLHDEYVPLQSIVEDLPKIFTRFWESEESRTCKSCGHILQKPEQPKNEKGART